MMATPVPLTGTIQYSTAECCSSLHLHHSEVRYSTVQQSVVLLLSRTEEKRRDEATLEENPA